VLSEVCGDNGGKAYPPLFLFGRVGLDSGRPVPTSVNSRSTVHRHAPARQGRGFFILGNSPIPKVDEFEVTFFLRRILAASVCTWRASGDNGGCDLPPLFRARTKKERECAIVFGSFAVGFDRVTARGPCPWWCVEALPGLFVFTDAHTHYKPSAPVVTPLSQGRRYCFAAFHEYTQSHTVW